MRHNRIVVSHYDGPSELRVVEEECPEPKNGEVRVRVLAAGVSLPDVMMREGIHPETPRLPFTPGWDLVGVVDRLGPAPVSFQANQESNRASLSARYRSTVHTRSSSACRSVNWFRCRQGWTPPSLSA